MTSVEQAPVDAQEIGAIFANEYYTFLSKEPARLHCFYSKDSTLSHGFQGEVTEVCVGQQVKQLPHPFIFMHNNNHNTIRSKVPDKKKRFSLVLLI